MSTEYLLVTTPVYLLVTTYIKYTPTQFHTNINISSPHESEYKKPSPIELSPYLKK